MAKSLSNMYAEILRYDLSAFIQRAFVELYPQSKYLGNWHIDVLAAKLEESRHGRCNRLNILMPPRHLKSFVVSVVYPAWLLGHQPSKQIMCVSYGQDLADKFARDSRTLMMSPFYQATFDTRFAHGREAISEYATTAGGCRFSTSVGGAGTGFGADTIIIDDALKADDALSESRRQSVNEWFDNTARTRPNSLVNGAIINVMQRLHCDDLADHVQKYEPWDVLSFPAIAETDETYEFLTPYGRRRVHRKVGEALHPEHMPLAMLEIQRLAMMEYNFTAQYQQNPQPESGVIVQRKWLKFMDRSEFPEKFDRIIQCWDTANRNTELANYSVCTTWGMKGRYMYLLDVFRRKLNIPELKRAIRELATLHRATVVLIEDKASGDYLIQELRAEHFPIVQAAPALDGDKVMRLHSQTAKIEGGFVIFPKEAHWLAEYLHELLSFPNSKYDDQVDSTVYALAWSTLNASKLGPTIESLDATIRFYDNMAGNIAFLRHAGCPWV